MRERVARLRERADARRRSILSRRGGAPARVGTGVARLPNRLLSGLLLIALSLSLVVAAAGLDGFLHRGATYGVAAEGTGVGGARLGMNVFLEKEVDRANIVTSVRLLREAGVTYVRQSFPWQEIEPAPGEYREWAKYDFIVNELTNAGIGILARVDTIPRWARPPTDDFARWDKGPPQDYNNYANFVGKLAERYKGKIRHYQVWNEPNLTGEWGGKPIDPAQYGLLLQFTWKRVKQVDPAIQIVTAGLAQTIEDGVGTNNLSELDFIRGLYAAGARPYFDILSVMNYGLGDSPEDRRVGPQRTNFSRLLLVREIMERYDDGAKPVWVSEYGWISLPPGWQGSPGTWGQSVDEATQARWTIEGIERMRAEWPWVGAVFVWAFRWVEPPSQTGGDPARHFEVVDHDFTPRPVYLALKEWAPRQAIATAGALPVKDSRIAWTGDWRDQTLGGRDYRVANREGLTTRLAFQGTDVRLRARVGPSEGRIYATIDGLPVPGQRSDAGGTYVSLRDTAVDFDQVTTLASGLRDGTHLLELRSGSTGPVALDLILIGRRQPFGWTGSFLLMAGLAGVFAGLFRCGHALATAAGWLGEATPRRRAAPAWWDTRE